MSSKYNGWVITNEGKKLLSRTLENQTKFKITKLEVGNGYNNGDDKLLVRLNSLKNSYSVNAIDRKVDNTVEVTFVVSNRNSSGENIVNTSYRISEMGIYAKDDTEREILYAYTKSEQGDYLPTFIGSNPIDIIQKCYIITEQSQNITLTIDGTITYVTQPDFEEYKNNLKIELDKKSNKVDTVTDISVENNSLIFTKNNRQNRFNLVSSATDTSEGIINKNIIRSIINDIVTNARIQDQAVIKINELVTDSRIQELALNKMKEFGIGLNNFTSGHKNERRMNGIYSVAASQGGLDRSSTTFWHIALGNGNYATQFSVTQSTSPKAYIRAMNNNRWTDEYELMQKQEFDLYANAYLGNSEVKVLNGRNAVAVRVNDILVYDTNNKKYYYKSKINGNITIPTEENTEKLMLGSGSGMGFSELKRKLMIGGVEGIS